jgi:hypothetical protein
MRFFASILSLMIFISCLHDRDYALLDAKNEWSHHFAYGSPSCNSFERFPENPVYSGHEGMEWPHSFYIESNNGRLPLDCVEVTF